MSETENNIEERLTQMYALAAEVLGLDPEYQASPRTVAAIRVYLKLYSVHDGNIQKIRDWLESDNEVLGAPPSRFVQTEDGLNQILESLQ